MNKFFYSLSFSILLFLSNKSNAQITWAENIAPVLYNNCTTCHHGGGLAPFSLMTYNEAVDYSSSIQSAVESHKMPPWPPDPHYRRLAHERLLSQHDVEMISSWVSNGSPSGNLANAPAPPTYTNTPVIANPDLNLQIPNYTLPAQNDNGDIYRCFVLPSGITVDKFITGMEVIPGNGSIVHHVLIFQDTTHQAQLLDQADPDPGYTNFGGIGVNNAILIGAWVPGSQPYFLPLGMGIKIYKNADIVLQIHYPKGSTGQTDFTSVRMNTTNATLRQVYIESVLNHVAPSLQNGPLLIPPNQTKTFEHLYHVPAINVSVLGVGPHMHLLGKQYYAFGVTPTGDTIPFIRINNWDFHWQGTYFFRNILKIPGGTNLYGFATYDNTTNNDDNPNNPPQWVHLGENTTDEMMLCYFSYALYLPGDENIVIDNSPLVDAVIPVADPLIHSLQLYDIFPNPASRQVTLSCYSPVFTSYSVQLIDLDGKQICQLADKKEMNPGFEDVQLALPDLPSGTYFIQIKTNTVTRTKKLIIKE